MAWLILAVSIGCGGLNETPREPAAAEALPVSWALAIHGGAGVIPRSMEPEQAAAYRLALTRALRKGSGMLDEGGRALDAVEQVIRLMEDDPLFNAGRGAVFNHEGGHELDASIMDGRTLECGAVTGVTTVKNPISLARRVMERTDHVLLSGAGAERFADEMGVDRVDPEYFSTERRRRQLEKKLAEKAAAGEHGTVGVVALDRHGDLAAGTSTGGLTDKLYGRVGDTPIIGAGTFADNASCAVSATGRGEEFIRHGVALTVCRIVQREGKSLEVAAREVIHEILDRGDGGIVAIDANGRMALEFNSEGMYRGSADSSGRFEVAIWR
jgi:beta-aspartyl-peptidase (threonine type)